MILHLNYPKPRHNIRLEQEHNRWKQICVFWLVKVKCDKQNQWKFLTFTVGAASLDGNNIKLLPYTAAKSDGQHALNKEPGRQLNKYTAYFTAC